MKNRFQVLPLEGLVNFKTGKLNSNAAKPDGTFPFFTCSQETYRTDTWSFDGEYVLLAGNNAAGIYPLKYFNGKFDAYQRTYAINTIDENVLVTRYVYYALRLQLELMKSISTGVATKFLTLQLLNRTQIPVPPPPTQRKIAAILSAYDDLIENNLRRIKILEEMAQNLYREWFVKFRFPGYQLARFIDSPLGPIPEGWEVSSISDVAIIHRGRSYKGTELADEGGRPFINLKCIERDGGFRSSGIKRYTGLFKESQTVRAGEMVMAITDMTQERRIVARVGRVSRLDADFGVISMDLVRVASRGNLSETYLYAMLRWSGFADEVKQHANGANVLHLLPDRIEEYRFVCPTSDIAARFGEIVLPMLSLCDSFELKNTTLRRTRDLLLPRLISGEVDVSALDIAVPEEAGV
ncbi:MAG: restriction endonuclease subunit S [Candidatus Latescibacterota bacterium]